jgi:hypothetical protein
MCILSGMRRHASTTRGLSGVLLGLSLAAFVPALGAQADVRGVLFDSLITFRPVPDALLRIEGSELTARTDRRGRFEFKDVPAGEHVIQYRAPWLDSLSLPPLRATVIVRGRRTVRIGMGTPTIDRYHRAVCGATFDEGQGVLRGEVRDAAGQIRSGIFVGAVWSETILTAQGLAGQLVGTIDTTDANGIFSLCGVPRETDFFVRAGNDTIGTGDLSIGLGGRSVDRRDLLVGDRSRAALLSGRVVTQRGAPITAVVIDIPGDSTLGGRVDERGRFALDGIPLRTNQLFVWAIGFTPRLVVVDVSVPAIELPDIVLEVLPMELEEMRIVAEMTSTNEAGFRERQRSGRGVFIDADELARYPVISANILAMLGAGVRSSGGSWPRTQLRRGIDPCYPRFFIDGVDFGVPRDGVEEAELLRLAKRIEIHEASFMPGRFTDFNGCGVVLIWTR